MDNKKYRWRIDKDHLYNEHQGERHFEVSDAGRYGPLYCYKGEDNPAVFTMYDDDEILYYSGIIWGEYTGFEPLDDWGAPNAGCTSIKINGKEL